MSPHSECFAFYQYGSGFLAEVGCYFCDSSIYLQDIVSVKNVRLHSVARPFVGNVLTTELLIGRCGQAVAIVFHQKNDRKIPNGGHVQCLMKIALARATLP